MNAGPTEVVSAWPAPRWATASVYDQGDGAVWHTWSHPEEIAALTGDIDVSLDQRDVVDVAEAGRVAFLRQDVRVNVGDVTLDLAGAEQLARALMAAITRWEDLRGGEVA